MILYEVFRIKIHTLLILLLHNTQYRTGYALIKLSCSRRTRENLRWPFRILVNGCTHRLSHWANNLCIYSKCSCSLSKKVCAILTSALPYFITVTRPTVTDMS
jgi:hypothetical protein